MLLVLLQTKQGPTPLNSKLPSRADQPHRSKQMEQRDSPDRVTVTAISFLQYMFGHEIQFWAYLPLYFIPSLPIQLKIKISGLYLQYPCMPCLSTRSNVQVERTYSTTPVSSSTRVQPMGEISSHTWLLCYHVTFMS